MNGKTWGVQRFPEVLVVRITEEDKAYLEKMRADGGEHKELGPFVRSILQALIADDKASEAT
jgi:hypothetical protein